MRLSFGDAPVRLRVVAADDAGLVLYVEDDDDTGAEVRWVLDRRPDGQ